MSDFTSLGVPARLVSVLDASGVTEPFPIQRQTLPDALAGRDVLGRGRTGSGKTLAFALPLVARLSGAASAKAGRPRGLVLAPTRELATQIAATIRPLADAAGLRVTTVFGGVSQKPQVEALRAGVDIVVACPGRLEDLMQQKVADLGAIEVTVIDEADHMADLGFLPGVTRILAATPRGGQRMLFSATLDRGVDALVARFLQNEVRHSVDEASVPQGVMTHRVLVVPDTDAKTALVRRLASGTGRRILFTRTKHQAKKLAKQLTAAGIPAVDLHGNLAQNARDRNLAAFGAGDVRVLVATDVAARGVHVDDVELVVHVDPPVEHKAYLHRSGRTARAGAEGTVVTVALDAQRREVGDILGKARIAAPLEPATDAAVAALVGEVAAYVKPAPVAVVAARPARGARPAGSRQGSPRGGDRPRSAGASDGGSRGAATSAGGSRGAAASAGGRSAGSAGGRSTATAGGRSAAKPDRAAAKTDGLSALAAKATDAASARPARPAAPAAGRTAQGRPTTGARVGGGRTGGPRRAQRPAGR